MLKLIFIILSLGVNSHNGGYGYHRALGYLNDKSIAFKNKNIRGLPPNLVNNEKNIISSFTSQLKSNA